MVSKAKARQDKQVVLIANDSSIEKPFDAEKIRSQVSKFISVKGDTED